VGRCQSNGSGDASCHAANASSGDNASSGFACCLLEGAEGGNQRREESGVSVPSLALT